MLAVYNALKKDWKLASYAAAISAVIELPVSQYYETKPKISITKRVATAGIVAFVSVVIGSALVNRGA